MEVVALFLFLIRFIDCSLVYSCLCLFVCFFFLLIPLSFRRSVFVSRLFIFILKQARLSLCGPPPPPVFRDMYRSNNHRAINPTPSFNNYIVISTALARRVKAPNSSLSISTRVVESLTMGRHDTLEQRAAEVRIYKIPLDLSLVCQEIGCKLN